MENNQEIQAVDEVKQEQQQPIKRGRGRPPKPKETKIPRKNGRPLKYEGGCRDYKRKHVKVEKNRYKELIEREKKYLEMMKEI